MQPKTNGFLDLGTQAQDSAIISNETGSSRANVIYPPAFHASANVADPASQKIAWHAVNATGVFTLGGSSLFAGSGEAAVGGGNAYEGDIMSDPTREELDAKLAAVEARTETRFVELSGKIDRIADSINALTVAVTTVKAEVKEDGKFTRWTVGVTLIASLIAFAGALWVTQGNMLSAFQAGLLLKSEQAAPAPVPSRPPNTQH